MNKYFLESNDIEKSIMSKKELAQKLNGKQVEFIFTEEDEVNIVSFIFDNHIYIFDTNIK